MAELPSNQEFERITSELIDGHMAELLASTAQRLSDEIKTIAGIEPNQQLPDGTIILLDLAEMKFINHPQSSEAGIFEGAIPRKIQGGSLRLVLESLEKGGKKTSCQLVMPSTLSQKTYTEELTISYGIHGQSAQIENHSRLAEHLWLSVIEGSARRSLKNELKIEGTVYNLSS